MKYLVLATSTIAAVCLATASWAKCPARAPSVSWPTVKNDKSISGKRVKELLYGNKINYGGKGSGFYLADGQYYWQSGKNKTYAKDMKIYGNGVRCLDYQGELLYVKFVVNDRKLVAVQLDAGRYVGTITRSSR